MQKKWLQRNPWSILAKSCFPWTDDSTHSRWRSLSCMGCSCRTRLHLSYVRRRILPLQTKFVDLSRRRETTPNQWEKRSDFNQTLSTLRTFTPRCWRTSTRAHTPLEVQGMETGIEFFFFLVAMARILVVFLRIQESQERGDKQRFTIERENPSKTSDKWFSRIHSILLQIDVQHQWTRECARSCYRLLSLCSVFAVTLISCTPRIAQDVRVFVSSHPCMKWAFSLTSLIPSSPSSPFSLKQFYPSTSPRSSSKIPCALRYKEMRSTDESFSHTDDEIAE